MKCSQSVNQEINDLKLTAIFIAMISSCGSNIFEVAETDSSPLDAATRALEKEDSAKAINILLKELGSDAANLVRNTDDASLTAQLYSSVAAKADYQKYLSVLSAAYAQSGGLDPIDVFLNMSEDAGSANDNSASASGSSTNNVTSLFPIMPAATAANILAVDKALYIIEAIPTDLQTSADTFKIGLLLTGSFTLKLKALDLNGDGTISPEEALNIDSSSASAIISSLSYAISSLGAYGADQESNQALDVMNTKLGTIQSGITGTDGADDAEKLGRYLSQ